MPNKINLYNIDFFNEKPAQLWFTYPIEARFALYWRQFALYWCSFVNIQRFCLSKIALPKLLQLISYAIDKIAAIPQYFTELSMSVRLLVVLRCAKKSRHLARMIIDGHSASCGFAIYFRAEFTLERQMVEGPRRFLNVYYWHRTTIE